MQLGNRGVWRAQPLLCLSSSSSSSSSRVSLQEESRCCYRRFFCASFWSQSHRFAKKGIIIIDDQNDIIIAHDAKFPIRRRDIDISQTRLLRNAALLRVRELETSRSRARAGVPETNRGEIRRDDDGGDFRRDVSQPESCSRCVCCLLYTSPSPRDATLSRMPSSA